MFLLVMKTDLHLETSGPRYGLKFFPSPPNIRSGGRRKWPFWILYLHVSHGEINAPLSHPDVKTIFRMEKYTSHKTTVTVARKLIQGLIPQPAFNLPAFPPSNTSSVVAPKREYFLFAIVFSGYPLCQPSVGNKCSKTNQQKESDPTVEGRKGSCLGGSAVSLVRWCEKAFLEVGTYPAKDGDFILRRTSISEKPE